MKRLNLTVFYNNLEFLLSMFVNMKFYWFILENAVTLKSWRTTVFSFGTPVVIWFYGLSQVPQQLILIFNKN